MRITAKFVADKGFENVILPIRATHGSAGYDFIANEEIVIRAGTHTVVDTHVKVEMPEDVFLMIVPRSGLGFKHGIRLANTVGVIDADYYSEEPGKGVIKVKLFNPSSFDVTIEKGKGICQGIFMPYYICGNDNAENHNRNGLGFGSTDNK